MYEKIHFDFSAFPDKYMGCRNRTLKYPSERSKQYNVFSKIKYIVFSKLKSDVTFQKILIWKVYMTCGWNTSSNNGLLSLTTNHKYNAPTLYH